jgi:hypothetical protein
LGIDDVNETPQAAILNTDGSFVATVDLWNAMPSKEKLMASVPSGFSDAPAGAKLTIAMGDFEVWHAPTGLAMLKQLDTNKFILITSGGIVSTLTPKLPKGYTVASLVQSDNRWLVRVGGPGITPESVPKYDLYEFRPDDGVLIRKLDLEPAPGTGAACEHNGEFKLIHWTDGKLYLETARPE